VVKGALPVGRMCHNPGLIIILWASPFPCVLRASTARNSLISREVYYIESALFQAVSILRIGFFRKWGLNITKDSLPGSAIWAIEPRGGCMLRRYETIFIIRADLQSEETISLIDRYAGIISGMDGTIIEVDNWGKRRLAYPIEKRRDGVYVRIDFVAQYKVVSEVERNFRIEENIIRFQTVKLSDKVDMEEIHKEIADARQKEEDQKKEEARKKEAAEQEARKREEEQKEEAVSESSHEEVGVSEDPESQDAKADDEEGAQETSPVETDEERAKEE